MGLSSSKSKSKSTQTATATPTTPSWITEPLQNYTSKVTNFANSDPSSLVAGAAQLQKKAFAGAQELGGWKAGADQALGMAKSAGSAGPATYNAPTLGNASHVDQVNIHPMARANAES